MVDLQGEDAQTIHSPGRTLRIQTGVGQYLYLIIYMAEVGIDFLYQIRTILIALVNATLQGKSFDGIDMWITNNILIMPLHSINPTLEIKIVLDAILGIRILNGGIDVISEMIVIDGPFENLISLFCK